jgi:hypothetical protein
MLLESLRPPADFQVDIAVGTTYSLDLIALMVAPVGFTFFDVDPTSPEFAQQDPLEILEAVRRHAANIILFYEGGRIAVPRNYRPLLTYLEDRIVAVRAPTSNRSFHPKVWFIRYKNPSGDVAYRLLCLSRNLTFDRCWDTVLTLDGELRQDRSVGFGLNRELAAFITVLPDLAITPVSRAIRSQVSVIQREIGRVEWNVESCPFDIVRFWPLGFDETRRWPFTGRLDRVAVISPFLSDKTLARVAPDRGDNILISRRECLDKVSDNTLEQFSGSFEFSDTIAGAESEDSDSLSAVDAPLRGLHAKLYIGDAGRTGRLWTGSANATSSGFGGNVEFLVELEGKKSDIGIDVFLEKIKGSTCFVDLLQPYIRPDIETTNTDLEALQFELDQLRMPIASAEWHLMVASDDNALWSPTATTAKPLPVWGDHINVQCRLASFAASSGRPLDPGTRVSATFSSAALESLTSFVVIEISGAIGQIESQIQFLVNAELIGAPTNRRDQLLRHMLQDKQAVLRFLLLLLSDVSDPSLSTGDVGGSKWRTNSFQAEENSALLEPLLAALDRSPARLEAVNRLLAELAATEDGQRLIPDNLMPLFDAIWQARDVH